MSPIAVHGLVEYDMAEVAVERMIKNLSASSVRLRLIWIIMLIVIRPRWVHHSTERISCVDYQLVVRTITRE